MSEKAALVPTKQNSAGFVTQVRENHTSPAILAEQQRAKSEIEAALTIAAARPRDQKMAMDRIITSCQRPGLASRAKYRYSKGGTDIEGVTIDLMEVVAQNWGNIDFGFRELARFPGAGGGHGESIVEAFAWDLETNVKRKVQFTVEHRERTKKGMRIISDPRDIYEWIANQAQRRVRTCLENIIPRDIYETAGEECDKTMEANVGDIKEAITNMIPAFAKYGVTKDMLEARLQRRLDTISAAQVVYMKKIWAGLRDGISKPSDWFDMGLGQEGQEEPKSSVDVAKEKMRKQSSSKPAQQPPAKDETKEPAKKPSPEPERQPEADVPPEPQKEPEAEPDEPVEAQTEAGDPPAVGDINSLVEEYREAISMTDTLVGLRDIKKHAENATAFTNEPDALSDVLKAIEDAENAIRASRTGNK